MERSPSRPVTVLDRTGGWELLVGRRRPDRGPCRSAAPAVNTDTPFALDVVDAFDPLPPSGSGRSRPGTAAVMLTIAGPASTALILDHRPGDIGRSVMDEYEAQQIAAVMWSSGRVGVVSSSRSGLNANAGQGGAPTRRGWPQRRCDDEPATCTTSPSVQSCVTATHARRRTRPGRLRRLRVVYERGRLRVHVRYRGRLQTSSDLLIRYGTL